MRHASLLLSLLISLFTVLWSSSAAAEAVLAQKLPPTEQAWAFQQALKIDPMNISGVAVSQQFMALATDEGTQLEIFTPSNNSQWQSSQLITLSNSPEEIDLEALAWRKPYLYALGSHSAKRKKINRDLTQKQNLKRLQQTSEEKARQQLFRIQLNDQLQAVDIQSLSLQPLIKQDATLKAFAGLPSKENGIDIEGLAVDNKGRLLIGFRGPVLRGNITPLMRVQLKKKRFEIKKSKLLYLPLNGRGVRGLSETSQGFLVLSGAVGDQPLSYQVHLWSGKNALPGRDAPASALLYLCDLPASNGKPEGIQFLSQSAKQIDFMIVEDSLTNGQPKSYRCPAP